MPANIVTMLLMVLLSIVLLPSRAFAAVETGNATTGIEKLASRPYWLKLGHWRETFSGRESEIDNDEFFLAENGRHDPVAELRATLRGLRKQRHAAPQDENVLCRYPARATWLAKQMQESFGNAQECPAFSKWHDEIQPGSITLIFPAAYLNNPASMYGHTLLRIDPPGKTAALTSYAVNFAAQTTDTNGFVFAFKGLSGMYDGKFGVMPYYRKVNEYNGIENRDIWEYPLDLSAAELQRVMLHLWELDSARFEYYFFDENCSYQLLTLLEVARDELALAEDYSYQVIPADTVKQLIREVGLAAPPVFRPALATQLDHQAGLLDDEDIRLAKAIAAGNAAPNDLEHSERTSTQQARVLDQAYGWLRHQHNTAGGEQKQSGPLGLNILRARSDLPEGEVFPAPPVPATAPESGHDTTRLGLVGGELDGIGFHEARLRAAYHDLLDPSPGFTPGAAITMGEVRFRQYEERSARLHTLDIVSIQSLSPHSAMFAPKSWKLHARLSRDHSFAVDSPLAFDLGGSLGATWQASRGTFLFVGAAADLLYDNDLPDGHAEWRAGPELAARWQLTDGWVLLAEARSHWSDARNTERRDRVSLAQSVSLGNDFSLRLEYARESFAGQDIEQARLSVFAYF